MLHGIKKLLARLFSAHPGVFPRGVTGRLRALARMIPAPNFAVRTRLKIRILRHVNAELTLTQKANLLDRELGRGRATSFVFLQTLVTLARELTRLPKVLPRVVFRERLREHLLFVRPLSLWNLFRPVFAPAALLIFVGVIALTSFVYQTQPTLAEVARLSIQSGTVKIREANSIFFLPAVSNTIIKIGDTIRVERDSTAALRLLDQTQLKLVAGSEVSIKDARLNLQSAEQSSVRVALISGSVEAKVVKPADSATLQIETSSGVVSASKAEFAVAINEVTGATEVITKTETVAVQSSVDDTITTAVNEGETALFAATTSEVVVTKTEENSETLVSTTTSELSSALTPTSEPDPETLRRDQLKATLTQIDLLRIRMFDALIAAQAGRTADSRAIAERVTLEINKIFQDFGGVSSEEDGDSTSALRLLLANNFASMPELFILQTYFSSIEKVKNLLIYYDTPIFRRGVPEFEIVVRDRYRPTPELMRLFVVLSARKLAALSANPLVEELITEVTLEYAKNLNGTKAKAYTEKLLRGMGNQPIYLSTLEKMREIGASEIHPLLDVKISMLRGVLTKYAGDIK